MVTFCELHEVVVDYYKVYLNIDHINKLYLPIESLILSKKDVNAIIIVPNIFVLKMLVNRNINKLTTALKNKKIYVIIMFLMPENTINNYYDDDIDDDNIIELNLDEVDDIELVRIKKGHVNILHTINNYQASDYFKQLNVIINRKFIEKPKIFNALVSNKKEFKSWYNSLT